MRGILAAAGLALRRARQAPGRWLPAAVPVMLAVGLFGALSASGVVAGDHAARGILAGVSGKDASAILTWNYGAGPGVDAAAREALPAMGATGEIARGVLLFPTDFGRTTVRLGGIAPLARHVELLGGRLPRAPCTRLRCEVLWAGGPKPVADTLAARNTRLVVVGRALIADEAAVGFTTSRGDFRPSGPQPAPPLLISGDPEGVDGIGPLESVTRIQSWSAPLPLRSLHAWDIAGQIDRIAATRTRLDREVAGLTVTSPQLQLERAQERSRIAPERLAAAGATAAAALAAFLLLAAGGMRRGLLAEDTRLRRSGATALQRAVLVLVETAVPVLAGLLAGLALAAVVAVLRARAGGIDTGHVLGDATGDAAGRLVLVGLVAWALAAVAARAPAGTARAGAAVAAVAGGALLAGMLAPRAGDGSEPLPGAVVPIAGAVAGLLVALALPPILRQVARAAPRRRPLARMSLLELAREPGAATVAAAGLAVSVGLAGFAFAYRSTLDRSRDDQARHRVPVAAVLLPGPDLRSPLRSRGAEEWARLPGAEGALPVLRRDATVALGPQRDSVTLVGLDAEAMGGLDAWRPQDAAGARAELASRLRAAPFGAPEAGIPLPADARSVALPARADGDNVVLRLLVRAGDGTLVRVPLGTATAARRTLTAELPARARGGTAISVTLDPDPALLAIIGHQAAEGDRGTTASGVLALGALRAGAMEAPLDDWKPRGAIGGSADAIRYHLAGPAQLRPDQPSDAAALPVLADPRTARDASAASETIVDVLGVELRAEVVGVVRRFPTVPSGEGLLLADRAALAGALDAATPGAGEAREVWVPGDEAMLGPAAAAAARDEALTLHTHAEALQEIRAEPIAREVLGALTATALLAAALALAGVAVAVRRALRDDAAALLDLEGQGVGPGGLRAGLRLRGAAIAVAGVVAGLALALALTGLVTSAVRAGAVGVPDPPLVTVVPWTVGALAALVLLAAAFLLGALAAAPALRERRPLASAAMEAA